MSAIMRVDLTLCIAYIHQNAYWSMFFFFFSWEDPRFRPSPSFPITYIRVDINDPMATHSFNNSESALFLI